VRLVLDRDLDLDLRLLLFDLLLRGLEEERRCLTGDLSLRLGERDLFGLGEELLLLPRPNCRLAEFGEREMEPD